MAIKTQVKNKGIICITESHKQFKLIQILISKNYENKLFMCINNYMLNKYNKMQMKINESSG